MRVRPFVLALLAVLAVRSSACFAAAPPHTQAVAVTRATLANGLRVVILRDPLAPVVSAVLSYEVGADDEPLYGLAHAVEHMMFRGSRTLDASRMADITALVGGDFDAGTESEVTQYFFTMPAQDASIALHLEASRAAGLLLEQKAWNQERGAIEQEVVQDNSQALYRLGIKVQEHLLAGTPYADDGLGSVNGFRTRINAPQLRAFYRTWYHPNNAVYVIAGDVDPGAALALVRKLFGPIPAAPLPKRKAVRLAPVTAATFTERSDQAYTTVSLNWRFPGFDEPDYAAGIVLGDVLNSQRGALYALAISGKALGIEFDPSAFPKAGIAQLVSYVPVATKPADALADLRNVLAQYRTQGVPPELVVAAKTRELAQNAYKGASIEGLASEWSQALAVEHRNSPDDDVAAIAKVSAADVDRVLRRYLDPNTATIAYAVPKNAGAARGEPASRAGENNTVVPAKHEPLPAFAQEALGNLQVPRQTTNPSVIHLRNGLTLVVQTERVSPTVVVEGLIRTEPALEAPSLPAGVASLTEELMPFGTRSHDRLGYQAELDKVAANVSTGTSFSLSVPRTHFERGLALLAEDELYPAFPQEDFEPTRDRLSGELAGERTSPDHLAEVELTNALYPPGDPERRFATEATLKRITPDDVKAWFAKAYRPDLTTLVVVGDVTAAQARSAVERAFGSWRARGPRPRVELPKVPANRPASRRVPATGRVQDSVHFAQTLGLVRNDPDYAALAAGNTVLSGGFYASQLYHDLRETHGYVYFVGTTLNVGKTRSAFELEFGASPEHVRAAAAVALRDIAAMGTRALSPERLRRAQALLLSEVPIREQSYDGIALQLLGYATEGLPLDQNVIDARRELRVTPAQVKAAFARWVRPNGFVRVVEGPEPR